MRVAKIYILYSLFYNYIIDGIMGKMFSSVISSLDEFLNSEVFDMAAKTGSVAYSTRVDRTQINNLLEIFFSEADPVRAASLLLVHITRQISRGEISRSAGALLLQDIKKIISSFKGEKLREAMTYYLTLVKWVFESRIHNAQDFESFVQNAVNFYSRRR